LTSELYTKNNTESVLNVCCPIKSKPGVRITRIFMTTIVLTLMSLIIGGVITGVDILRKIHKDGGSDKVGVGQKRPKKG